MKSKVKICISQNKYQRILNGIPFNLYATDQF
jgi:hypothetical protein